MVQVKKSKKHDKAVKGNFSECDLSVGCNACPTSISNADRIRAMSNEELGAFLESLTYEEAPWDEEFHNKCCQNCPEESVYLEGYHRPLRLHECDFKESECPHGNGVLWWLSQQAKEDKECD